MFLMLREKLAACLADATGEPAEECEKSIEMPKGQFGDVASSICFSLAKTRFSQGEKGPISADASRASATAPIRAERESGGRNRELKKNPVELARGIAGKIRLPDWIDYVKAEGP